MAVPVENSGSNTDIQSLANPHTKMISREKIAMCSEADGPDINVHITETPENTIQITKNPDNNLKITATSNNVTKIKETSEKHSTEKADIFVQYPENLIPIIEKPDTKITQEKDDTVIQVTHKSDIFTLTKSDIKPIQTLKKPKIPICITNNAFFFSSNASDTKAFNGWFRANGWGRPYHIFFPLQITLTILVSLWNFIFLVPLLPIQIRYYGYVFTGFLTLIYYLALIATVSTDPQDCKVIHAKQPRNLDFVKYTGVPVIDQDSRICQICCVKVGIRTRHCKVRFPESELV